MIKPLAFVAFCAACGGPPPSEILEHQAVISKIESTVQLPAGARPLDQYSRNYAKRPDGKFVATYIVPVAPLRLKSEKYGCDVALADFTMRPCTHAEMADIEQPQLQIAARFGLAGEARWFEDVRALPFIDDGGCDQIDIVFDPTTSLIESVECNGDA